MPPAGAAGVTIGAGDDGALGVGEGDGVLGIGAALGCAKLDVVAMPAPALGALCAVVALGGVCCGATGGLLGPVAAV